MDILGTSRLLAMSRTFNVKKCSWDYYFYRNNQETINVMLLVLNRAVSCQDIVLMKINTVNFGIYERILLGMLLVLLSVVFCFLVVCGNLCFGYTHFNINVRLLVLNRAVSCQDFVLMKINTVNFGFYERIPLGMLLVLLSVVCCLLVVYGNICFNTTHLKISHVDKFATEKCLKKFLTKFSSQNLAKWCGTICIKDFLSNKVAKHSHIRELKVSMILLIKKCLCILQNVLNNAKCSTKLQNFQKIINNENCSTKFLNNLIIILGYHLFSNKILNLYFFKVDLEAQFVMNTTFYQKLLSSNILIFYHGL